MIKVYDIETTTCSSQTHSVVAENIGQAEHLFLAEYPGCTIKRVILHSEYVVTSGQPSGTENKDAQPAAQPSETCKLTKCSRDLASKELRYELKTCPTCGKRIEVVE